MSLRIAIVPAGIVRRASAAAKAAGLGLRRRRGTSVGAALLTLFALVAGGCAIQEPQQPFVTTTASIDEAPVIPGCEAGWSRDIIRTSLRRRSTAFHPLARAEPLHSRGDIVRLDIPEGADFAGVYKVNLDGHINVPYAGRIPAAGQSTAGLIQSIRQRLIRKKLFHPGKLDISVIPVEWAPIQISVSGAVFQPGRALTPASKDKARENIQAMGDSPAGRFLDSGLMIAGGVRPDADLGEIVLSRSGRQYAIDISGVLDGAPVPDITLMHGDHIEVLSTGCRQAALVRPSQVTPTNVRIFFSNMSIALPANLDQHTTEVPYGSRLLDGAVAAHCVGGTYLTNAGRRLAYINNTGGGSRVREIRVRDLLANPDDLDVNPYMMPNDAIACFDSEVTNIRDVSRTLYELLTTFGLAVSLL